MTIENRLERYAAIESYRKRPLIVYATSTRARLNAQMAGDVVREFIDQADAITTGNEVDVLIHSTGGDGLTAWKLMSLLRERFDKVCVLVPFMAFSAATIFALGADEIVMHPHASLGPIDPQIRMQDGAGGERHFAYEDVGAFLRFITQEVRITEQTHTATIIERLFAVVDPLNVGAAKRASDLATDMGERLLKMHMRSSEDQPKARAIAENLNKSFFAHGDAVSRARAKELNLKMAAPDPKLEKLLWDAYVALEDHMQLSKPFDMLQDYLADPAARAACTPPGPLVFPVGTPPQIQQQAMQVVMNDVIQKSRNTSPVPFSYVVALCESLRTASESVSAGEMSMTVQLTGEMRLNSVQTETGWRKVTLPTLNPEMGPSSGNRLTKPKKASS